MNVAYFFKCGRRARLQMGGPLEFLYGQPHAGEYGVNAQILEDVDYALDIRSNILIRVIDQFSLVLMGSMISTPFKVIWSGLLRRLNQFDVVIVPVLSYGVAFALLKKMGLLRANLFLIAMGMFELKTPRRILFFYKWVFKGAHIACLSRRDAEYTSELLNRIVPTITFGVDTEFWNPGGDLPLSSTPYVLSIGNDPKRDYETLLKSWTIDMPLLHIITNRKIKSSQANIKISVGDWQKNGFSDEQIRELIRNALVIVIPVSNCIQPSGQSAGLQAMSCAKTVIITDYPGLWDRDMLVDGKTCLYGGPPGDSDQLQTVILGILNDPILRSKIGVNARQAVQNSSNIKIMANTVCQEIFRSSEP